MNRTITGKEAFELLGNAEAFIIEDGNSTLVYGYPEGVGDGEYELELSYSDEGLEWDYYFSWEAEDEIEILDNQIMLREDNNQDVIGIKLLQIQKL